MLWRTEGRDAISAALPHIFKSAVPLPYSKPNAFDIFAREKRKRQNTSRIDTSTSQKYVKLLKLTSTFPQGHEEEQGAGRSHPSLHEPLVVLGL